MEDISHLVQIELIFYTSGVYHEDDKRGVEDEVAVICLFHLLRQEQDVNRELAAEAVFDIVEDCLFPAVFRAYEQCLEGC